MKLNVIFPLFRSSKLLLITGAVAFALHTQVPLARADDCGLPASLFKDGKPPNQLRDPKCEECKEIMAKLQAAVNDCYAMQLAEADKVLNDSIKPPAGTQQRFQEQRANALKGLGQPADKGAAAKATQKENSAKDAKDNKGKSAKEVLKNKIEKLLKELEDCEKNCPEKKEETTTGTPTPTPTPEAPPPPPPPPQQQGGGGPIPGVTTADDKPVYLPVIPANPTCKNLEDLELQLQDVARKLRSEFAGASYKGKESDLQAARDQIRNLQTRVTELKAKLDCPKEQKSMPPPSPGQEQKSMAPGQPPPADQTSGGAKLETTTSPGVVTKTISVMDEGELVGEVVANLPDDPTGTFTGTVEAKPAGKTDEERARNQAKLNEVIIKVGDQQTKPADNTFTCTIPPAAANQPLSVIVVYKDKQIAKTSVAAAKTPPAQTTTNELPWFGQTGRNLVIPHSCDGKVDPTDSVKVGGQTLPLIVETQQGRVVRDTSNALGPTELEFSEQGQVTRTSLQNMSVQLSANKNRLKPNEQATLKVTTSGMSRDGQPLGVEVVNNSTGIVNLSGGSTQHVVLQPSDVGRDGSCLKTFTLTGKTPGAFNIRATLESPTKSETPR